MSFSANDKDQQLKELALKARLNSYSPYSGKKIGACIELENGKTYSGCNIENASFGGTVCAERVAILKAYSENDSAVKIKSIVVSSDEDQPWPPCGLCRQVIAEFGTPETQITLINLKGVENQITFAQVFPMAFEPKHLK